jgi:glycosyltransferase involved in cell wall biosynthesis
VRKKLAIITSHPIQYNAPLFALISKEPRIELMVFYTWGAAAQGSKYKSGFGKCIEWDIPLLEGYNYTFLINVSKEPGSHHFYGIINPSLNKELDLWGPDVVWIWGWAFDSHLKAMRYFKGKVPVWFRGDSTLLDESNGFSLKKVFRHLFLSWVYSNIDKAFYVGTRNKDYFKAFGLKDEQLIYAPHAIDNDRFVDAMGWYSDKAKKWRKELGISESQIVLLFVGKFEPKKNPNFMKKLLAELKELDIIGIMVGNGILEQNLKHNKPSNLHFLPFQNQLKMPVVYRLADILVLPSKGPGETWGLVINEAMACGVPVLASNKCGGAIDLITDKTGFIFDSKSIIGLNQIEKLLRRKLNTGLPKFDENYIKKWICTRFSYSRIIETVKNELAL